MTHTCPNCHRTSVPIEVTLKICCYCVAELDAGTVLLGDER